MKSAPELWNLALSIGQLRWRSKRPCCFARTAGILILTSVLPASTATGKVFAWGDNSNGQTNVPPGLTNVLAIAAGDYFSLALKANGTVVAWGQGNNGQTNVPADLSNVVAIAAGARHGLALKGDGRVAGWGENFQGQISMPAGLSNVVAIAAGYQHSLALKRAGTVVGWGWNLYNQANTPTTLSNVVAIAGGYYHSLALKQDGTVAAWGGSSYTAVPAGLSNVIAIAAGYYHSLALKADGTVVAWGRQTDVPAELTNVVGLATHMWDYVSDYNLVLNGNGTVAAWEKNTPLQTNLPPNLTNAFAVAAGWGHSLALLGNGAPVILMQPSGWAGYSGSNALLRALAVGPYPLHYQWLHHGSPIAGATNASLFLDPVQYGDAGTYSVLVSNSFGFTLSSNALVTVFLTFNDCIDLSSPWVMDGDAPWFGQTAVSHDGVAAVQTSSIAASQRVSLRTGINGPGLLSFWWKVSSQTNADFLSVQVAGVRRAAISGEVDWQHQSIYILPRMQTVEWIYSKDNALSSGADAAWLDELNFRPALYDAGGTNNGFAVTIWSEPGKNYTLEFKAAVTDPDWLPVQTLPGTGSPLVLSDPAATGPQGFYRVRIW